MRFDQSDTTNTQFPSASPTWRRIIPIDTRRCFPVSMRSVDDLAVTEASALFRRTWFNSEW